jgi:hypothetical protein
MDMAFQLMGRVDIVAAIDDATSARCQRNSGALSTRRVSRES